MVDLLWKLFFPQWEQAVALSTLLPLVELTEPVANQPQAGLLRERLLQLVWAVLDQTCSN